MARPDLDQPLQQSVLDRLIDANPDQARDPPKSRGQHLRELREAIRRDLENLLNARQRCRSSPPALTELRCSLVNYGIPDLTGTELNSSQQREAFRQAVEDVIRLFEPRF